MATCTVRAARKAHRDGLDWRAARERVREAAPHYVAQYSPTNMGFQVIGWLYGADFGDALCIDVGWTCLPWEGTDGR